jgi:hypothetical protein
VLISCVLGRRVEMHAPSLLLHVSCSCCAMLAPGFLCLTRVRLSQCMLTAGVARVQECPLCVCGLCQGAKCRACCCSCCCIGCVCMWLLVPSVQAGSSSRAHSGVSAFCWCSLVCVSYAHVVCVWHCTSLAGLCKGCILCIRVLLRVFSPAITCCRICDGECMQAQVWPCFSDGLLA